MPVRDALIAIVRRPGEAGTILAGLPPEERDLVLDAAVHHGLGTTVAVACHDARLPVPDLLQAHRFDMANRRAHIMTALGALAPALTAAGIPWAVLQGPVVATYLPEPSQREFVDLDILVDGARIADALDAFGDAGASHVNRNWEGALRHGVAEFPAFVAGIPVDVHWHLVGLRKERRRFAIPVAAMLERARPVAWGSVTGRRLDPEDNAIHVALHEGLGGAWRLSGLRDVAAFAGAGDLDMDTLVRRALDYGAAPVVGQVLDRCREVLDAAVPPQVAGRLAPPAALRARRWVDRRWSRGPRQPFSGIVVSAARRGSAATIAAASGQTADRILAAMGRERHWSAYDREGPLYWEHGSEDASAFGAYCRMAAEESATAPR